MKIYRAMCSEEMNDTVKYSKPSFKKRFKWFSPSLDFILTRVKDGKFNNSGLVKSRYDHLLEFEIENFDHLHSEKEIQIDVRKNITIKFIRVLEC